MLVMLSFRSRLCPCVHRVLIVHIEADFAEKVEGRRWGKNDPIQGGLVPSFGAVLISFMAKVVTVAHQAENPIETSIV